MFKKCKNFDQSLNNWDVSNVSEMFEMFYGCKKFNQSLNNWLVLDQCDCRQMFENADLFNINENAQWYNIENINSDDSRYDRSRRFIRVYVDSDAEISVVDSSDDSSVKNDDKKTPYDTNSDVDISNDVIQLDT